MGYGKRGQDHIVAGVFIFSLAKLWAVAAGIAIWVIGQWALTRAAGYDDQLSKTGLRSRRDEPN